jgi:hypothetical protein
VFRRNCFLILWIAVILAGCAANAPAQDEAPHAVNTSNFGERIQLGPNWLFKAGDDPAWASPSLDDRGWKTVDSKNNLYDYGIRDIRFCWYRIHVRMRSGAPPAMIALQNISGSYEVYANGARIGGNGSLSGVPFIHQYRLLGFSIPPQLIGPNGDVEFALRFRVNPTGNLGQGTSTPIRTDSGIFLLSREAVARDAHDQASHVVTDDLILAALSFLVALVALGLFVAMRGRTEYLAAFIFMLANSAYFICITLEYPYDYNPPTVILRYLFFGLTGFAYIEFIRVTLNLSRTRWLLGLQVLIAICSTVWSPLAAFGIGSFYFGFVAFFGPMIAVDIFILALVIRALRARNREARVLLPAVFLLGFEHFWWFSGNLVFYLHITRAVVPVPSLTLGGYQIGLAETALLILLLTVLLFLVVRTVGIARLQAQAVSELEAAREIQQQLVPVSLTNPPGFKLGAAYLPATEVGGDFYQVIEQDGGAFLVVIGDVSGKGLKAAMTCTLALGALRALAAENLAPAELLARLNAEVIRSRGSGFITCLCARIAADGTVTLANAGHLSPYRNGEEIVLESGFPLGIAPDVEYDEALIRLAPGESLTLLSDGVVEARNADKELFGFERAAAISRDSAERIANAAQSFGQEDDITVLTVAFVS